LTIFFSYGVLSKVGLNVSVGGETFRINFPSLEISKSFVVMDGCRIIWVPSSLTESYICIHELEERNLRFHWIQPCLHEYIQSTINNAYTHNIMKSGFDYSFTWILHSFWNIGLLKTDRSVLRSLLA
jgi:hypothetical protein